MIRMWGFVVVLEVVASACACERKPAAPSLLEEGESCDNDDRCVTGLCDGPNGENPVCVRRCSDICNSNEVCVQLTPNRFSCQPDKRKLCTPCETDSQCPYPSDKCVNVNNENVCGRDCAFDQTCPSGYRCINPRGVDGTTKVQQCVPIVASCACLARGDFMQQCEVSNTLGTCFGVKECDLMLNQVVCSASEPVAETCNGLDDDCDGQTDEGQMNETCGVGECVRQVNSCVDGGTAMCTPGDPVAETCNGKDDDCDGTNDNGFDLTADTMNCGTCGNVCNLPHASSNCSGSSCRVVTCDMGWSNCNMMDPDGCESDVTMDPMNCGACNATCTRPNSTATCVNSACQFACAPGYIDLNNDPADGCEYACTTTSLTDLPDLAFTDANCDGIDGELSNGIFVSPSGSDSAAGTRAAPKQTIAAALSAATSEGKRDIYVAHGSYTGPLQLTGIFSALNVAGGYHPTTWQRANNLAADVVGGNPALVIDSSNNMLVQLLKFQGSDGVAGSPSTYGAKVVESSGVKLEGVELRSGNALAGSAGASQAQAANGNPGLNGGKDSSGEGCYNDPRWDPFNNTLEFGGCNTDLIFDYCSSAYPGGQGGSSSCGSPGGAGGSASRYNPAGTANGQPGAAGQPGGGAGGTGVSPGTTPTPGGPNFGGNGGNGTSGGNGNAATAGSFNSNGFVLGAGTAGTSGTAGRGGGGGGGGAGGLGYVIPGYNGLQCYTYGSVGAGGGAGGCGGNGGGAGISGGASVALFLFNAQVTGQAVALRPGNGGAGGAGGNGGSGGTGGSGATPGYNSKQGMATRAGAGGRGGDGGSGGHGGGGAGGPVYGIAKNGNSTWTTTGGSVMLGTPGAGGTSPGNSGPAGASGIQTTF